MLGLPSGLAHQDAVIATFLLALAVIVLASTAFAALARRLRQPAVVGEVVAGLALGPSLLGLLPGHLSALLFPTEVRTLLNGIAQLGLVLFMFLVGWELDMGQARGSSRAVGFTAAASLVVPFGLGFALAAVLYSDHSTVNGHAVGGLDFGLFIGTAMAITAFPVLARIIKECGLERHRLGVLSMLIAAVDDVVAWCLLILVVTLVSATSPMAVAVTLAGLAGYVVVMTLLVRPALRRLARHLTGRRKAEAVLFMTLVVGLLGSAWATTAIGLHPVFGAFLFGAMLPRAEFQRAAPQVPHRVGQLNTILLPVFFVVTGLSVDLGGLGWLGLAELGAAILVACAGKFGGAAIAAPVTRLNLRDTIALGALLNTRGLTELIVLGIGLQVGVLDDRMFTVMVITAVATTVLASPLLRRLIRPEDAPMSSDFLTGRRDDAGIVPSPGRGGPT
ncbi:cation:proton antiporter [Kutzneria sp. 744]|uniref:cation:proton antiporter domain-containing protein n=1 Tax=Kutzneria sp. (strain 744) TaxID=345341 RepID=UPI0004AF56AC|nr:cation:proton antiporter [Kutzneria sp. 744]